MTPTELYNKVVEVVGEQEEYIQTLMFDRLGLRWGEESIPANTPTTITLNQAFDAGVTDYLVWRQVTTADSQETEVVIIPGSQTNTSFQVWCSKAVTFKYITTYPNLDID